MNLYGLLPCKPCFLLLPSPPVFLVTIVGDRTGIVPSSEQLLSFGIQQMSYRLFAGWHFALFTAWRHWLLTIRHLEVVSSSMDEQPKPSLDLHSRSVPKNDIADTVACCRGRHIILYNPARRNCDIELWYWTEMWCGSEEMAAAVQCFE